MALVTDLERPIGYSDSNIQVCVEFWLELGPLMMQSPFYGQLQKVYPCFMEYIKCHDKTGGFGAEELKFDWEAFMAILDMFNEVSGDAIQFSGVLGGSFLSEWLQKHLILYIDRANLYLLQAQVDDRFQMTVDIKGSHESAGMVKDNDGKGLLKMLQDSCHTEIVATVTSATVSSLEFDSNYSHLTRLLNKESAMTILGRERAKVGTVQKPFFEICEDPTHANILSKVCLSRKDIVNFQGNNNKSNFFPSLDQCYQLIETNKKLFSQEIYKCGLNKIHHLPIINSNTDKSLGDCSYLDTCHKMKSCRYLHYFTLTPLLKAKKYKLNQELELKTIKENLYKQGYTIGFSHCEFFRDILPPQWINCDVRYLPFLVLGKFSVILSDPAWDIHMSLPYGTCTDDELMGLPMHELQDEGIMLLWVTGRSIEIGRRALKKWGYVISDELIWLKLNQLKRTIVTGRTGHWLNHSKEHLLVGLKGTPPWINRMSDINTIVSGTRETLRKPDEVYDLVERIVGAHSRKLEIFGRDHNVRPGWLTIGNQLSGTSIHEKDVLNKYNQFKSTEVIRQRPKKPQNQKRH